MIQYIGIRIIGYSEEGIYKSLLLSLTNNSKIMFKKIFLFVVLIIAFLAVLASLLINLNGLINYLYLIVQIIALILLGKYIRKIFQDGNFQKFLERANIGDEEITGDLFKR